LPIPEENAMRMVRAAHAMAVDIGIFVTAVVVDEGGRLVALGRMDNATPVTVDLAMNKAYTAASFQQPTIELQDVAGQGWFQSLVVSSNGRFTPGGGAVPVTDAGRMVGAVSVAGGTDAQDQRCCEAAVQALS
jgi:uncharacterized protein GlcG (DUF336 family)